jgi:Trk K+ transport system NAD-binding subunit
VLVVRGGDGERRVAPRGDQRLAAGDELLVAGERGAVDRFREAVA